MKDSTKLKIIKDDYSSHNLHACYYWTDEVERLIGKPFEDTLEYNHLFEKVRKQNKELDKLRSLGKSVSFGLVYGAYPKKVAHTLKQPLKVGEALFNRFHNDLYFESTKYKEEYVLPITQKQGYIHLGMGAKISTDNPDKDIRTLVNSTIQVWSLLTLMAIHKVNKRIKKAGYQDKIRIYSSIHDSILAHMINDPKLIQWYNSNLIECMIEDFIVDQPISLQSNLDIGFRYDKMIELPNNCSIKEIENTIKQLKE